jgi:hypothetical protein
MLEENFFRKSVSIPSYRNKLSFGDMDVIMVSDNIQYNFTQRIQDVFRPTEIVKNSNVYSFDYKELQIDLILTNSEIFQSSLDYYSFNDLGNLVGRIAHKFGLKYGHKGLSYVYREDTKVLGEILLTRDTQRIYEFLGYDYSRYQAGFDELTDIFDFVVSSPYYAHKIYDLDNRNHVSRVRDRKRETYTKFLTYAKNRTDTGTEYNWNPDKSTYIQKISDYFPHFKSEYDGLRLIEENRKLVSAKFNGNDVSKITGYTGKELGMFIRFFKTKYIDDDFTSWVLSASTKDIHTAIVDCMAMYVFA